MKLLILFFLMAQAAQQQNGTVSGQAIDAESGQPIAGLPLFLFGPNGSPGPSMRTDDRGNYKFADVAPGQHALMRTLYFGSDYQNFMLDAGGSVTINYRILQEGEISGRVYDENKDPIAGMPVHIVMSQYEGGLLRYLTNGMRAVTNDRGEYSVHRVPSGRALYVLFEPLKAYPKPVSQSPPDPKLRKPAYRPTYYPRGESVQTATAVKLRSGEKRDGIDIQIQRSPSYCIDGMTMANGQPSALDFAVSDAQTWAPNSNQAGGKTGRDGKFRVCDLYPGTFVLTAQGVGTDQYLAYGAATITIDREDIHSVTIGAVSMPPVSGNVSWDGEVPPNAGAARLSLGMTSGIGTGQLWWAGLDKPLPFGPFSFHVIPMTDFAVYPKVSGYPTGYVKEITYGGISVLHRVFRNNGDLALQVTVGADGGMIKVSAPQGSRIAILPESAPDEAYLSSAMLHGDVDSAGSYASEALAPGKYYVVATKDDIDMTPECLANLWRARTRASEVDVSARGTAAVTIAEAIALDSRR